MSYAKFRPFNITGIVVCSTDIDGSFTGTPVELEAGQTCNIEPQSVALDPLMGYGKVVELATIVTHINFTLGQGGIDLPSYTIMTGATLAPSGTTPNRVNFATRTVGGEGLPYFGMIAKVATVNGGNVFVGLPRCKLDTLPPLNVSQNGFVMSEVAGKGIANPASTSHVDVPMIVKGNETAAAITLTSAFFDTFFGIS